MAGHSSASRGQVAYEYRAKRDARPAGALDRTGGLVPFVGKRYWEIAHFTRERPVFMHGGLVSHATNASFLPITRLNEIEKVLHRQGSN